MSSMLLTEELATQSPKRLADLVVESGSTVTTHPEAEQVAEAELPTTRDGSDPRIFVPLRDVRPIVQESLEPLQEWEGIVDWIDGDRFGARMTDITEEGEEEYTEFSLDEISDDDHPLVVSGGVFYWTIARETLRTGQRRHVSMVRFRRLPIIPARQRLDVRQEADSIADALGLGSNGADAPGS